MIRRHYITSGVSILFMLVSSPYFNSCKVKAAIRTLSANQIYRAIVQCSPSGALSEYATLEQFLAR